MPKSPPSANRASSKLDRIETSKQTKTYFNSESEVSYANNTAEFQATSEALLHLYSFRHPEIIDRYQNCGTDTYLYYDVAERRVVGRSSKCHLRWCPLCSSKRAGAIAAACHDWLMAARNPSFITLTLQHYENESLRNNIARLHQAFKILRRSKTFKQAVFGGIWFFQTKRGRDSLWHSHLHIAADSEYIRKSELSDLWQAATGDSKIVDIQRVKSPKKMAAYVARYVSRPMQLQDFSFDDRIEIITTLHGKRMFGKWGTAAQLNFKEQEPESSNLVPIASLRRIAQLCRTGIIPRAKDIYRAWRDKCEIAYEWISPVIDLLSEPPPENCSKSRYC